MTTMAAISSWDAVDLGPVLSSDAPTIQATVLRRTDGVGLFYPGRINGMAGEAEVLKGWLALHGCQQEIAAERHAVYIDWEDSASTVVRDRLHRALGIPEAELKQFLHYLRPEGPITDANVRDRHLEQVAKWQPSLVVYDGLTEALGMHRLSSNADVDVAAFHELVTRPVADLGAAVAILDHVVKNREERGRYAVGSQHKLAAISGAAYAVQRVQVARRGFAGGHSRLVVTKDRLGYVRGCETSSTVADFFLASDADGRVFCRLEPPDAREDTSRRTGYMERISRRLEDAAPGALTQSATVAGAGRREWALEALRYLVEEEYVDQRTSGGAIQYTSVRPFREDAA